MSYTKLNDMRNLVENRTNFEGNSVVGKWMGSLYAVFSYGEHFPMYIYDTKTQAWVGNGDKWGVTTSKHQSKCRPNSVRVWLNTEQMRDVIRRGGYVEHVVLRGEIA